jgi:D-glycero-D-manno-heptose 1,7-bisphosphate phosphatase
MALRRAAFLDRDGVVNIDRGYVYRAADFEFVPHVLEAARQLREAGYALVVVTNQSGIGRGLYSTADYEALTAWMRQQFNEAGAPLAGVYHCPHHPTEAQGVFRVDCACRKPSPGLLLDAARELGLDLARSVLFGDRATDLEAAETAGVPMRVLLGTDGLAVPQPVGPRLATARFASLAAALDDPGFRATLASASAAA